MSAATTKGSALRALVLFMVCLSIAGTLVAGAHWFVIDKPQQEAMRSTAPRTTGFWTAPRASPPVLREYRVMTASPTAKTWAPAAISLNKKRPGRTM